MYYLIKNIKLIFLNIFISTIFIIFFIYFTYAAIYGNNGLKNNIELNFRFIELSKELELLEHTAIEFETKTSKLRIDNLDLDLLDQQARSVLGLIRSDEIILIE